MLLVKIGAKGDKYSKLSNKVGKEGEYTLLMLL